MSIHWRVMLSPSLWDQEKFAHDFVDGTRIAQSKGRCPMKVCPKKDDCVSFVYKGKVVMRGVVESDGFEHGCAHHAHHPCNRGESRPHTIPEWFAWIRITEVGLSVEIRKTGQRTWAKMPIG